MQHAKPTRRKLKTTQTTALMKRMVALLCVATLVLSTPLQSLAYDIAAAEDLAYTASESTETTSDSAEDAATSVYAATSEDSSESESTADDADATEDSSDAATEDVAESTEDADTDGTTDSTEGADSTDSAADTGLDTSSDATEDATSSSDATSDTSSSSSSTDSSASEENTSDTTDTTSDTAAITAEIAALVSSIAPLSFGISPLAVTYPTADDEAYISALSIANIVDGTAAWNTSEGTGNDMYPNNGIVRTFDTVTYTLDYTLTTHGSNTLSSNTVYICFEFILPVEEEDDAEWDTDSMTWISGDYDVETIELTYDFDGTGTPTTKTCLVIYGYFGRTGVSGQTTLDGTITPVIQVLNAANNSSIAPIFTMWIAGNQASDGTLLSDLTSADNKTTVATDAEACVSTGHGQDGQEWQTVAANQTYSDSKNYGTDSENDPYDYAVTVTCEPRYNIQILESYSSYATIDTFDFSSGTSSLALDSDAGSVYGRLTAYGVTIQLYNDEEYGLKGVEVPTGEITFDITLTGMISGTTTASYAPLVYSWGPHENSETGYDGRSLSQLGVYYAAAAAPYNSGMTELTSSGSISCYQGGTWEATKSGSTISVTVSDYKIVYPLFPNANAGDSTTAYARYFDPSAAVENLEAITVGSFSAGAFYILTPYTSQGTYTTTLTIGSVSIDVYGDGTNEVAEASNAPSDNTVTTTSTYPNTSTGSSTWRVGWSQPDTLSDTTGYSFVDVLGRDYSTDSSVSWVLNGQDALALGSDVAIVGGVVNDEATLSSNRLYAADILVKFDGSAVTLTGEEYVSLGVTDYGYTATFLYAVQSDGSNWASDDVMEAAKIEDLVYYSSLDTVPDNSIVVAYLVEIRPDSSGTVKKNIAGTRILVGVGATVNTNTELVGNTYQCVVGGKVWRQTEWNAASGNIPTLAGTGVSGSSVTWPAVSSEDYSTYDKTTYGTSSVLTEDSTAGTMAYYMKGDTLLVLEATPSITKTATNPSSSNTDSSGYPYFYLDNAQLTVDYELTPTFESSTYDTPYETTLATLTVTDILPEGLTYVQGSQQVGGSNTYDGTFTATPNGDGTTTLTWVFNNVSTTADMSAYIITYQAQIDPSNTEEIYDNALLTNTASITYNGTLDSRSDDDLRTDSTTVGNMATAPIRISLQTTQIMYKTVAYAAYDSGEDITYTLTYANRGTTDQTDQVILDVLPTNGLGATSMTGSYTVSVAGGSGMTLYYRTASLTYEEASGITSPSDITTDTNWIQVSSANEVPSTGVTALAWVGTVASSSTFQAQVTLTTSDMLPGDVIANRMYRAGDYSVATAYIGNRTITGFAWLDENEDGIQDPGESALEGITVTLLQQSGSDYVALKDTNNNDVSVVTSSTASTETYTVTISGVAYPITATALADGSYEFSGLPAGTYAVQFSNSNSTSLAKFVASAVDQIADFFDSDGVPLYYVNGDTNGTAENASTESNQLLSTQISSLELPSTASTRTVNYTSGNNDSGFYYKKGSITITKTDTDGNALEGAVFTLEIWDETANDGVGGWVEVEGVDTTTNSNGQITYSGLAQGTKYRITETYAASGYAMAEAFEVEIPASGLTGQTNTYTENGTTYTLNVNMTLESAKGLVIPLTGLSPLSAIFFVLGVAIIAVAVYVLYRQRTGQGMFAFARASNAVASTYQARAASRPQPTRRRVR